MKKIIIYSFLITIIAVSVSAQKTTFRSVTVVTQPNTTVWIDDVKRGITDASGKLTIKLVASGIRKLRLRANGFKEVSQNLTATQSDMKVVLIKTTDQAELTFQKAEAESDKEKAIELYEEAVKLRPKYAEAFLGMARNLDGISDVEGALKAIASARKIRPIYPEASAVEGRIYKNDDQEAKAIASFKRAIKEGNGFQPEAHTGLALLYKEKAERHKSNGDFDLEAETYQLATDELKIAITQLSGTEPTFYEILGSIYEKMKKFKEAIAVYEDFIRTFPESNEVPSYRSYIVQVRKQMEQSK
jgi:tetratricopeptide (TPR) repeat protein